MKNAWIAVGLLACAGARADDMKIAPGEAAAAAQPGLTKAQVVASVDAGRASIQRCYDVAKQGDAKLGQLGIMIRFVIGTDGEVAEAANVGATSGAPAVEACVRKEVEGLSFPAAKKSTEVRWSFQFGPGVRDLEPVISAPAAPVKGSLDKEIIRRVIRSHLADVKRCYELRLRYKPTLAGRVMIQFTIAGSGKVIASVVQESDMNDAETEACIAKRVRGWVFPKPVGGGIVIVSYPFVLKTEGAE